jgi:hypothetical protein
MSIVGIKAFVGDSATALLKAGDDCSKQRLRAAIRQGVVYDNRADVT